jgi:predicted transcriptional regulator
MMKTLRIGIGSAADVKAYKAALARRRLWGMAGEPESWVSSAQSLGKLRDENWPLLREIRRRPPRSMSELAGRTGRSLPNLSRTLKSLESYGLVSIEPDDGLRKRPRVAYDRIVLVTAELADAA